MSVHRWSLYKEGGKWVIRRWRDGKYERLPVKRYASIRDNEEELQQFLLRLNAAHRTCEKVAFKHAFINDALLAEYEEWLTAQIPTERNARCEFGYLKTYFLNYFIGKLDLMNPLDWHKVHETKWAKFLMGSDAPPSVQTKRAIIQAANRFMDWLHKKRPAEVPPLTFKPISRASFKEIQARRILENDGKNRMVIPDQDLEAILKAAPASLLPFIQLALKYGLRRSETLGVRLADVKNGYLSVERQLATVTPKTSYRPLKGRTDRKVPHWNSSAAEVYAWVQAGQAHLIHPDTLTDRWSALIKALREAKSSRRIAHDYDFHDLRHTFITRAIRAHSPREVQLAAGHVNIETTMRYLHDDRTMDDAPFVPKAA